MDSQRLPLVCWSLQEGGDGARGDRGGAMFSTCLELTGRLQELLVACTCSHTTQSLLSNTLTYAVWLGCEFDQSSWTDLGVSSHSVSVGSIWVENTIEPRPLVRQMENSAGLLFWPPTTTSCVLLPPPCQLYFWNATTLWLKLQQSSNSSSDERSTYTQAGIHKNAVKKT